MFNNFTDTELSHERWKDIDGYDGAYQVSDLGRVRSLKYGRVKVLRAIKTHKGYLLVNLYKDGNIKHFLVHRLVAQAFIENDDETKTQINHIDECKQNNRLWNLEYCTAKYNTTYNDIHHRRITKRCKIKHLYNPNLNYEQNIELFKANGIECSEQTVFKLRRDLKLIQPHPKYKRDKVKSLYNPDLTYNENLDIFKANGVECSRRVIKELRRDLGLTGSRNVRNKVKDLYDQNLNYEDNLKVFKENGVECSRSVIFNIRKQLGLVKSTKKK